jgi:toxin ParE1/3/4
MKVRLGIAESAKRDMRALIVHIGADNPKAALQVSERIVHKISLLQEQPHLGRVGRQAGTRELVVSGTPYIVIYIYRVDMERQFVQVLRIVHHAQRWPAKV